tara:strand:- start:343 stop:522 length:180 start_codon:yes stop_codon:yes gene_type:complete
MRDILLPTIGVLLVLACVIALGGEEKMLFGVCGVGWCFMWGFVGACLICQKHWKKPEHE